MSDRSEFIATLRSSNEVMARTQEAYDEYISARDAANTAFCTFANRYGIRSAVNAQKEARGH